MHLRTMSVCAFLLALPVGSAAAAPVRLGAPPGSTGVHRAHSASSNCPVWSGGTGILADGDFSEAPDPGTGLPTFHRGAVFAPDWTVTGDTIDLYGSTAWGPDTGYCSVDLDGTPGPGGIRHTAFATKSGQPYTVTFLLSGNGACGPTVKTMSIIAARQFTTFTWDISNGNDAQHGVWLPESWVFKAHGPNTILQFKSKDSPGNCGPVVAAISVTPS